MFVWHTICTGLKYIWKTLNLIRIIFLNIVFFFCLFLLIGLSSSENIPQSGVLILDIEGVLVDTTNVDQDFYELSKKLSGNKFDPSRENSLFELTKKIDQATSDNAIKGIILKLDKFNGGSLPSLEYLAKHLKQFKAAGKPIYAYGSKFNQKQYYLASLADKIYLSNIGSVEIFGFAANNFYFKSLLDNLKVNTYVYRVGTYKSAVEPYIRDDMSEEAKLNTRRWLMPMWKNYLSDISQQRDIPNDMLAPDSDTFLERLKMVSGNLAEYALENKIIDSIKTNSEFEQEMKAFFNTNDSVSIYDYQLQTNEQQIIDGQSTMNHKPEIAIVFVNGTIVKGDSTNDTAGSETIAQQIKKLTNNSNIRAVVLRINSPGGSVDGSEEIRSELAALREKDIPVVVSMGGLAASGGYWIATESDYIYASSNTITGSIGIFGILPNFENSLSSIGVHTDGVATSPLASLSVTKAPSEQFNQLMQMTINNGYDMFISLVSQSRNMNYEAVDKIAQGQVWLGEQAKENGLVDEIGDIDNAVLKAATLAGITDYTIYWQKQDINYFNAMLNNYSAILPKSLTQILYNELPMVKEVKQRMTLLENLNDPQNRYIYCLNCAEVN